MKPWGRNKTEREAFLMLLGVWALTVMCGFAVGVLVGAQAVWAVIWS